MLTLFLTGVSLPYLAVLVDNYWVFLVYFNLFIFVWFIPIQHFTNFSGNRISLFCILKVKVKSLIRVRLFATPWTLAYQASLSMGFFRQKYWSGLPFPSPGNLPNPGIEPGSPALEADTLTSEPPGKPSLIPLDNSSYLLSTLFNINRTYLPRAYLFIECLLCQT